MRSCPGTAGSRSCPPETGPGVPDRLAELLGRSDLRAAENAEYDPVLLDEARRFAADLARPGVQLSPRGAGAAALVVADRIAAWSRRDAEPEPAVAQAWVARGGVVFAVRAVAEMAGMLFHPRRADGALCRPPISSAVSPGVAGHPDAGPAAAQGRGHRAVLDRAPGPGVSRGRGRRHVRRGGRRAGGYRSGAVPQRLIASFVLPDRDDWVDEDIDALVPWMRALPQAERVTLQVLPVFSATRAAQVRRRADVLGTLDSPSRSSRFDIRLRTVEKAGRATLIMTLLDGLGTEAVPLLTDHPVYRAEAGFQPVFHSGMTVRGARGRRGTAARPGAVPAGPDPRGAAGTRRRGAGVSPTGAAWPATGPAASPR
ncbi:hypothetical protein [Catenuloplanes indicus]|uniref:Uncharacterized protein n=1 Tax=Catenuloplanes indicus TaxID=137267 RepID=A0AAE3VUR3_9ACTN|nr:hypothetical protein [Catenuloplanes indicus]MDQ0364373.1 hypothetical protein [Catenuloplanes indicus]